VRAFLQRYERLVRASARLGLEALCERILTEHDYDLAVLARWDGGRRFANLRKLGRLARDYEAIRGNDIAGFVRFVREQEALGAKELEAVAEEEGGGAVRLLTIHAAKGLEFKVVIVADAGRDVAGPRGLDEIVALSDGRFGFRMVHPTKGERQPVFGFEEVREAERDQERAERLRLYYVAMTRAIDRLIVSGAIDPDRSSDRSTPIGWVLDRLDAHGSVVEADDSPVELERGEARFVLTVNRHEAGSSDDIVAITEADHETDGLQLALFDDLPAGSLRRGIALPPLGEIPAPTPHDVRRLSYSAIALFERCSYRYFAERVLGLPPREERRNGEGASGLAATELGDAVHRLLELVPLDDPVAPAREELDRLIGSWYPDASAHERDRVAALVDAYCHSSLANRIAELRGAQPERPFAFEHDGVVIRGRLDVLWREGDRALVVDYKSNALEARTPTDVIESEYTLQRLVYALVCLRAGATDVEVAYQFLEQPNDVVSKSFTPADAPELESELSAAIARIRAGEFRPTPSEFACSDCPALDLVCAGPRLGLAR
jgi:ATP-dependent helicase/nuclease subunit A